MSSVNVRRGVRHRVDVSRRVWDGIDVITVSAIVDMRPDMRCVIRMRLCVQVRLVCRRIRCARDCWTHHPNSVLWVEPPLNDHLLLRDILLADHPALGIHLPLALTNDLVLWNNLALTDDLALGIDHTVLRAKSSDDRACRAIRRASSDMTDLIDMSSGMRDSVNMCLRVRHGIDMVTMPIVIHVRCRMRHVMVVRRGVWHVMRVLSRSETSESDGHKCCEGENQFHRNAFNNGGSDWGLPPNKRRFHHP